MFFSEQHITAILSITVIFRIHTSLRVGVCSCCQDVSKSVCFEQTDVSQKEYEMHSLEKKRESSKRIVVCCMSRPQCYIHEFREFLHRIRMVWKSAYHLIAWKTVSGGNH